LHRPAWLKQINPSKAQANKVVRTMLATKDIF